MVITQFEVPSQYSTGRSEKAVKNFNQLGVLTNQLLQSGIFTRYFYDYEQKKKIGGVYIMHAKPCIILAEKSEGWN